MKRTPGPWVIRETPESSYQDYVVVGANRRNVASVDGGMHDARLIAAAPALLAACKAAADWMHDNCEDDEPLRQLRDAIAQAEAA